MWIGSLFRIRIWIHKVAKLGSYSDPDQQQLNKYYSVSRLHKEITISKFLVKGGKGSRHAQC